MRLPEFYIPLPDTNLRAALQEKIDHKTKPPGALGQLETLALMLGLAQGSLSPSLVNAHIVVFAGDHGITDEGVSAYPQAVTAQMVLNFCAGGAAINVFARQNGITLRVVDAGVAHDFSPNLAITHAKIGYGTENFLRTSAMTETDCEEALKRGAAIVDEIAAQGCNIIGFGEMGIGNTTSAAAIMHIITQKPLEYCVGAGTGLDGAQIRHKRLIIAEAISKHNALAFSPLQALTTFGGYEIAMMCGAMLGAASQKMIILVDGFIATSALLVAHALRPEILYYCIFAHESNENGHAAMHRYLGVEPFLRLGMRLGEGTGAALAYPLVQAAVGFLNDMATFDSAKVSEKISP